MKKVTEMLLITGGSGFIGKYLSAHIVLNTDEKIRIFSSNPDKFFFGLEDVLLSSLNHIKTLFKEEGNMSFIEDGSDVPDLEFNIYTYNQISSDMKLYLDLYFKNRAPRLHSK